MSAGRRAFALSDLSSLVASGRITVVTGAPGTGAPVTRSPEFDLVGAPRYTQPTPRPLDRRLDHDGDWAWRKPVDHPYRTTPADVLEDAVDLAIEELPIHLAVLVDTVVYMRGGPQAFKAVNHQERKVIEAKVEACRLRVLRELPKLPSKRVKRKRTVRPRTDAPCSSVVTRRRNGTVLVDGRVVAEVLPEHYAIREDETVS